MGVCFETVVEFPLVMKDRRRRSSRDLEGETLLLCHGEPSSEGRGNPRTQLEVNPRHCGLLSLLRSTESPRKDSLKIRSASKLAAYE